MAFTTKKFDVRVGDYSESPVVLSGTVAAGDFATLNEENGFYFEGGVSGDTVTFVTKARKVAVEKAGSQAWVVGEAVYWDSGAENVTNVASTNVLIGFVVEAAASAATEGIISFDGSLAFAKA